MKKEVDKLVENIQKKLELKSSVDTIPQIDLYNIMKNRLIVNRFNEDFKKIKEKSDIFKGEYQRFKIIATKAPYKNVSEMKEGANITTGSFTDTMLTDKDGKTIQTYDAIVNCMEAGVETYEERRKIYENLKV